jgi:hypothetical protein
MYIALYSCAGIIEHIEVHIYTVYRGLFFAPKIPPDPLPLIIKILFHTSNTVILLFTQPLSVIFLIFSTELSS